MRIPFFRKELKYNFNSNVQSSDCMNYEITNRELIFLEESCRLKISKEYKLIKKIKNLMFVKILYLIYKILKILK